MFVAQNAQLWAEPGRALVAEAGSIVTRVDLRKGDALYLNDGAYGNLFDATHANWPFPVKLLRAAESRAKSAPFPLLRPDLRQPRRRRRPVPAADGYARRRSHRDRQLGAYGAAMGDALQRLRRHRDHREQGRALAVHVWHSRSACRGDAKAQAREEALSKRLSAKSALKPTPARGTFSVPRAVRFKTLAQSGVPIRYLPANSPTLTPEGISTSARQINQTTMPRRALSTSRRSRAIATCLRMPCWNAPRLPEGAGRLRQVLFFNANGLCAMEIDDFAAVENHYWPSFWPAGFSRRG